MAVDYIALSAYLDGEIVDDSERRAIERLLQTSPVYAQEFEGIRRARALLKSEIVRPTFHRNLMARVQELEDNGTFVGPAERWWWRAAGVSAVVAALLAAGDYTGLYAFPDPPNVAARNAARPALSSTGMERAAEELRLGGASAEAALVETGLPLTLRATAGGNNPIAVIANRETGFQGAYKLGEEVMPGVRLADVRYGQAVLEHADVQELLTAETVKGPVNVDGDWRLRVSVAGRIANELELAVRENRGILYIALPDETPYATGRIQNGHIFLDLPAADGGVIHMEGDCGSDSGEIVLTGVVPTGNADEPHLKITATASRINGGE